MSQEIEIGIDWEKLANDLKEKFNIDANEEDIEIFCCDNETKYLIMQSREQDIEDVHTNDLTDDEEIIEINCRDHLDFNNV